MPNARSLFHLRSASLIAINLIICSTRNWIKAQNRFWNVLCSRLPTTKNNIRIIYGTDRNTRSRDANKNPDVKESADYLIWNFSMGVLLGVLLNFFTCELWHIRIIYIAFRIVCLVLFAKFIKALSSCCFSSTKIT